MTTALVLCESTDCPNDANFEHRGWPYGCVPKDFSERTGRSRRFRQRRVESGRFRAGYRYMWNGGCDAIEVALIEQED